VVISHPPAATVVAKTSGDAQDGIVGQPLAKVIQVLVTESNVPLPGATVTWLPEISDGVFTPASTPTDANGLASTVWTLGPYQGIQIATVSVTGSSLAVVKFTAGSPLTFKATAVVDPTQTEVRLGNRQPDAVVTNLRYRSASSATRGGSQPSSSPISSATRRAANAP
jgi:hypothetical protein